MANNNGMRRYLITIICGLILILGLSLPVCAANSQNVTVIGSPLIIYHLNISSTSGGNVSVPGEGTFNYVAHSVNNISAVADPCYHFVNWTGNTSTIADVNASSTTITMNGSYTIQANFAINTYTLTYNAGAGGSINGTTPQTVNCGSNGSAVTAVPNTCYHFVKWSDDVTTASRTDTNVTNNLTVTASFSYRCGGGGGGGTFLSININILGGSSTHTIDSNGVLQNDVDAASPDGKISIHIAGGTTALGQDGNPLSLLNIITVSTYPAPPDGRTVIAAFDFQPNGATFNPAIQITITYDPATLPSGTDESQLVIAFYNAATGQWQYVSGTVNPAANTITFLINHFTVFGIMSSSGSSATSTVTPTPTPTATPTSVPSVTPTPTITPTPTPTPTPTATPTSIARSNGGNNEPDNWVLIVLDVAGGALFAALIGAIVRRNRKSSQ
jgi:hypothetical protein